MKKFLGWILTNLHWLVSFVVALGLVYGVFPNTSSERRDGLLLLWLVVIHLDIRWLRKRMITLALILRRIEKLEKADD